MTASSPTRAPGTGLSGDLERRVWLTRAALLWEELCTAFWPLATYLGLLAAISLFDVWSWMPGWLHAGLFWLAVAGVAYLVWRAVTRFHWPSRSAAIERLERRNSLAHRPIAALGRRDRRQTGRCRGVLGEPGAVARACAPGQGADRPAPGRMALAGAGLE